MKKNILQLSVQALAILFLVSGIASCKMSEEALQETPQEAVVASPVFHATIEQADDTQTKVYTDASLHVLWNADDRITIFPKLSRNKQYRFTGADGASGGDFEEVASGFGTGTEIMSNFAIYPYNANTDYVFDDIIRTYFPREQTYRADSFGQDVNLMVARSTTTDLSFKNVGSYLCLKLYGNGISVRSIILRGNGDETLSGPVKISFGAGNIPSMVFDTATPSELNTEIVLKAASPVALGSTEADAVTFWMVVPPVDLPGGFTITVIDSQGGIHEKKTTKSFSFTRNQQFPMKAFELVAETPAALSPGIYPLSGSGYVYDKTTDQINILEAEGNAWVRFLLIPTLTMYEIGPIPQDVVAGTTITTNISTYVGGNIMESQDNVELTVQSLSGGMMNLVSDEGVRYVFRF